MSNNTIKIGDKFGRWTVIEINTVNPESKAKKPPKMALCRCECGTIRYKEYRDLKSGRSKSCGCLRNEQVRKRNMEKGKIKIGTVFGQLTVIEDLGYIKQNSRNKYEGWSLCQCKCGNKIKVRNNNLKSGLTKSCGCINSMGENKIETILKENNIAYIKEYTFSDLKNPKTNHSLRFDFAIFKDTKLYELIEFDGRQHYYESDATWSHSDSLEEIKYRDELKNKYCKLHNIKLIRIPYFKIDEIDLCMLELEGVNYARRKNI